jgi:hypothetical protein
MGEAVAQVDEAIMELPNPEATVTVVEKPALKATRDLLRKTRL